jgi:hypothetical protein
MLLRTQYLLLVLLRVAVALVMLGVVHPDELFQSVEVRITIVHSGKQLSVTFPAFRFAPAGYSMLSTWWRGSSGGRIRAAAASPLPSHPVWLLAQVSTSARHAHPFCFV